MLGTERISAAHRFLSRRKEITKRLSDECINNRFVPEILSLGLTDNCKNRCSHCFAGIEPGGQAVMGNRMLHRSLREASGWDIKCVVLTGGEPTANPDQLEVAVELAGQMMSALAIQTNALMPEADAEKFFNMLSNTAWGTQRDKSLQLNVSSPSFQAAGRAERLIRFIEMFALSSLRGRIIVEALVDCGPGEFEKSFNEKLGSRLAKLEPLFHLDEKQLEIYPGWPLMIGKAKGLRSTELGRLIRAHRPLRFPQHFNEYISLERDLHDVLGIDPWGFVYPSGLHMYLGLYPIGQIMADSLEKIMETAMYDPILYMIHCGQAAVLFDLACEINPGWKLLLETCADPFEVFADILEDHDNALALMSRAADHVIGSDLRAFSVR